MHTSRCRGAERALLLAQQVAAAAQAEAARQRLFTAGKRAYEYGQVTRLSLQASGVARVRQCYCRCPRWCARLTSAPRGQYPASVELLRSALDTEGPLSPLGGEIQLWLALGLQVLSSLEGHLPNMSIKRPFVAVHVPVVTQDVHSRAVSNAPIPHASGVMVLGQYVIAPTCWSEDR